MIFGRILPFLGFTVPSLLLPKLGLENAWGGHGCKAHLSQLLTFSNAVIGAGTLAWIGVPVWESVENNSLTMRFRGDNDIN